MALIEIHSAEGIGTLTLNYSIKRNTLSEALIGEMSRAFAALEQEGVRVLVLRAYPGAKVWSAGHNVDELPLGGHDPLGWKDPLRQIIREIEGFPAPVIAMVEGSVWGGACELVFACDLIIATAGATFAATPAKLGVPYNASGLLTFMNAASPQIANGELLGGDGALHVLAQEMPHAQSTRPEGEHHGQQDTDGNPGAQGAPAGQGRQRKRHGSQNMKWVHPMISRPIGGCTC